jgi:hypothetical protein
MAAALQRNEEQIRTERPETILGKTERREERGEGDKWRPSIICKVSVRVLGIQSNSPQ